MKNDPKKKKRMLKNEEGFTLVEIIAVLIILGVLAAVAIPKFMDLTQDAERRSLDGALSAGLSAVSLAYGKLALSFGAEPTVTDVATKVTANPPATDDFTYGFAATEPDTVTVSATSNASSLVDSADWTKP